jgi:peptidoglycan-associated lipoprotein
MTRIHVRLAVFALLVLVAACGKKPPVVQPPQAPATSPQPFPQGGGNTTRPPAPPTSPTLPAADPDPVVTSMSNSDPYANKSAEDINRDSPLKPVYFLYDSDQLDEVARQTLAEDAELLKRYRAWVITVEGHCDERGTAEYNLALGDRRALAAKNYLMSLGVSADRLRTVSYGKEFPLESAHSETAWSKNRRAHFTVTATADERD